MNNVGVFNMQLIRGNNKVYQLSFFNASPDGSQQTPIDLTEYTSIKMDIKTSKSIEATPFVTFTVGSGLAISGIDNNILKINFNRTFLNTDRIQFYYDILFLKDNNYDTLIEGVISIKNVVTI